MEDLTAAGIARTIDHSLLRPELTTRDVVDGCALAARLGVASVCVRPCDVAIAAAELAGTDVPVGAVVAFPHGTSTPGVKAAEARAAVADGARELDMVLNVGRLRGGDDAAVAVDVRAVVEAAGDAIVKVIIEAASLTDDEKVRACRLSEDAGAAFVKTSTGFGPGGATVADVRLMRASVSPHVGVKAAGGIRTLDALLAMLAAGATRIGATATAAILDEAAARA